MDRLLPVCPLALLLGASALLFGCGFDQATAEDLAEIDTKEQEVQVTYLHTYSFRRTAGEATWKVNTRQYGSSSSSTSTFYFGDPTDTPLLVNDTVATYGTTGTRLGYFNVDANGNRDWGTGDTSVKFMSSPQSGDKPFITSGQKWGRSSSGQCIPLTSTGGLAIPIMTRMVGVLRGTTFYVDRDGNGVWGGTNHCDLTAPAGTFAASGDIPVALGVANASNGFSVGVSRIVSGKRHWYLDQNSDLLWNPPPDFIGAADGFGVATDFVPASHNDGMVTQRGSTVYFDGNDNHVWNSSDATIENVISTNYELVGVAKEIQVY